MRVTKRRHRSGLFWGMCLCAVLIAVGGFYYISSVRIGLVDQVVSNVLTVTQQQEQALANFISRDRERIHSFAEDFARNRSDEEALIREKLLSFSEVDAMYAVLNVETAEYYNNLTTRNDLRLTPEELAPYLEFSGSGVREPYTEVYSERRMFGYYECFTFADGVSGIFQKGYESSKVSSEFSLSFYNGEGRSYVVNENGVVLLSSLEDTDAQKGSTLAELIDMTEKNQDEIDALMQAFKSGKSDVVFIPSSHGNYACTYVPVSSVEGWYLVSIVPESAIMKEVDKIINNSKALVAICAVVLLLFFFFIVLVLHNKRSMEEKDQEIKYQEELFNVFSTYLSKNTDDVYIMLEKSTRKLEYVSENFQRVFGISEAEDLFHQKLLGNYEKEPRVDFNKLEPGEHLDLIESEWFNKATGESKWFLQNIYCEKMQGADKIIIYISDRTRERRVQQTLTMALDSAKAASEAKSNFLSSMSHDIRTPMNAITGLVALLRQDANNPKNVLEYTQRIDAASQHLLGLINNVLDMNKIESGNVALNISEFSLAEITDELNTIIRPQTKAKKQSFEIYTSPFAYEHLQGDKMRINQVLLNILSNAVKYTQAGGKIELSVREFPGNIENFSRIQFTVKDNGQGMSEDYLKVIFDPFTREHNTFTNKIQGTGLGMAIVKNLVDLMGGMIKVESKEGEGSVFTIELELRIETKEYDHQFWEEYGIKRMIVADDDMNACTNIIHAMEGSGVAVDYVLDGSMVIDTIRKAREGGKPYDLILLDWRMPELDGLQTARLIRERYSRKIPILLLTAYEWADIEEEALEVGIDHFMPKPFFMVNFRMAIKKVMDTRKGEEEKPAESQESAVKGKNVLIVEDIEVNRIILEKILGARGATCDMAENGQEALEKFQQSASGQYDIILMDVQMPMMNGYEATKAIRACPHPEGKTVPIIAMTANAFAEDVRDAIKSGMDAHVSKPIVLDKLESTIKEVLDNKNAV